MRTRLVPRGTVGGRIAGAWSPIRNKRAAALNAADSLPYSTQKIGLTIASRRREPPSRRALFRRRVTGISVRLVSSFVSRVVSSFSFSSSS